MELVRLVEEFGSDLVPVAARGVGDVAGTVAAGLGERVAMGWAAPACPNEATTRKPTSALRVSAGALLQLAWRQASDPSV